MTRRDRGPVGAQDAKTSVAGRSYDGRCESCAHPVIAWDLTRNCTLVSASCPTCASGLPKPPAALESPDVFAAAAARALICRRRLNVRRSASCAPRTSSCVVRMRSGCADPPAPLTTSAYPPTDPVAGLPDDDHELVSFIMSLLTGGRA